MSSKAKDPSDRVFIFCGSASDAKCFAGRNGIKEYTFLNDPQQLRGVNNGCFIQIGSNDQISNELFNRVVNLQLNFPHDTMFIGVPHHMRIFPWLKAK